MVYRVCLKKKKLFYLVVFGSFFFVTFTHLVLVTEKISNQTIKIGIVAIILGKPLPNERIGKKILPKPLKSSSVAETASRQCNIPQLDPWHNDVLPYVDFTWRNRKCMIQQNGKVENGMLTLQIENVQRAGFYYIRRKDEDRNSYSEWHPLRDSHSLIVEKEIPSCLQVTQSDNFMVMVSWWHKKGSLQSASNVPCTVLAKFIFRKDKSIKHFISGRCLIPDLKSKLKLIILGPNAEDCKSQNAKFEFTPEGKLVHMSTNLCLVLVRISAESGFFSLTECENATKLHFHHEKNFYKDLSVTVPLMEDMVKVEYVQNNRVYTEYYNYPLKEPVGNKSKRRKQNKAARDPNKLNVLYFMIDSISRASAQRYLNSTYGLLEKDPNTVILKGHTIVGDGTTAQVLAMFVGKQEKDLPEARRGYNFSNTVDQWPWIWKEYEKKGYVTLYGEDESEIGTFNYRLKGFKDAPTSKYLRPWYTEIDGELRNSKKYSSDCAHKFSLQYIKNFYKEYEKKKKFMFHASNLGHNEPSKATSVDEDLFEFLQHLNKTGVLSNSVVVIFGDHGDRTASFRKTMQGKLEERLPFVSISLPSWFRRKFPIEMENLRKNADVLTSHYDLYATNKHLLTFPKLPTEAHKYGRSLFTDTTLLNRQCIDAGVHETWCPCINYKPIDINDPNVIDIASRVVGIINIFLRANPTVEKYCHELSLKTVIRANQVVTSEKMEYFVETFADEKCDECGYLLDTSLGFKKKKYEIVFEVSPSGGQYEVMIEYDLKNKFIEIGEQFMQNVGRINRYGKQPNCIARKYPYYRKFCFCKDNLNQTE